MNFIKAFSFSTVITIALFFAYAAEASVWGTETITYSYSETAETQNGNLVTADEAVWRLMETGIANFEGPVVVINQKGSRSGIAYFDGQSISVTLLSGEPDLSEGFRTSLLMADQELRRIILTDGTTRRVLDPDASLDFPANALVEIIITRDRRYAIDLSRGLRIAVSPPVRQ